MYHVIPIFGNLSQLNGDGVFATGRAQNSIHAGRPGETLLMNEALEKFKELWDDFELQENNHGHTPTRQIKDDR